MEPWHNYCGSVQRWQKYQLKVTNHRDALKILYNSKFSGKYFISENTLLIDMLMLDVQWVWLI